MSIEQLLQEHGNDLIFYGFVPCKLQKSGGDFQGFDMDLLADDNRSEDKGLKKNLDTRSFQNLFIHNFNTIFHNKN